MSNPLSYPVEEVDQMSSRIGSRLKERFDRALQGSDYHQRVIISAMIDEHVTRDDEGFCQLKTENLEVEKWSEKYG